MDARKMRSLANVRRFNFERCNRYQSVAEHSLFVAMLCMDAALSLGWDWDKVRVAAVYGMMHDAPEAVTGDIPFLVKRHMDKGEVKRIDHDAVVELDLPQFEATTPDVSSLVYFCDALELAMYLQEESASGNSSLDGPMAETYGRIYGSGWYGDGEGPLAAWILGTLEMEPEELQAASRPLPQNMKH